MSEAVTPQQREGNGGGSSGGKKGMFGGAMRKIGEQTLSFARGKGKPRAKPAPAS